MKKKTDFSEVLKPKARKNESFTRFGKKGLVTKSFASQAWAFPGKGCAIAG